MYKNKNCGAKAAIFFVAMTTLLVSMMLIPAGHATVGVKAGDQGKYGYVSASWNSNIPGLTEIPQITEFKNTAWMSFTVQSVSGNTVTVQSTGQYKNGTPMATTTLSGDIETGSGNLAFFIIPANLGPGDTISISGLSGVPYMPTGPIPINETITYARTNRPTNRIRYYFPMPAPTSGSLDINFYWDKATGVLCELSLSLSASAAGYSVSMTMQTMLTETNMWSGAIAPPGAGGLGDVFGQWWFWLIIVVVIVGAVGGVVVVRMRAKKVPVPPPTVPPPPPPPPA